MPQHAADIFRSAVEKRGSLHVANMSRGAAGSDWESLKRSESRCDMARHENRTALELIH